MIREFNLQNLAHVSGGRIEAIFKRHIQRALLDCEDRPGDKTKRKVTIDVLISPVVLQDGAVTDANIECEVSSKIPKHISPTINCALKAGGRAVFNDMCEADVDQRTIDQQGTFTTDDGDAV
jgi:hypothetical protein